MDKTTIITLLVLIGWGFTDLRMPVTISGNQTLNLGSVIGIILIMIGLVMLNYYYGPLKKVSGRSGQRQA